MIDVAIDLELGDVLKWVPLAAIVAIVSLWLARRDRANDQARQVSVESLDEWFIGAMSMLRVTVTNDSDKPLRQLEFSAWGRDDSGKWEQIGEYLKSDRVPPNSAAYGRLGTAMAGWSKFPKGDALRLLVTFQDVDGRWWRLQKADRAKRVRERHLKTVRAANGAKVRTAAIKT